MAGLINGDEESAPNLRNLNDQYEWSEIDEHSEHDRLLRETREAVIGKRTSREYEEQEGVDDTVQPPFHLRNKSLAEKCCGCCVAKKDLTRREVRDSGDGIDTVLLEIQVQDG